MYKGLSILRNHQVTFQQKFYRPEEWYAIFNVMKWKKTTTKNTVPSKVMIQILRRDK